MTRNQTLILVAVLGALTSAANRAATPAETGDACREESCSANLHHLSRSGCRYRHKMTRESWKRTVDNMIERGARGTTQEIDAIVDYLSKNFGAE